MAIPTKPLALPTMNPMAQEPDASIEAVVLKKRIKNQYDRDGYSLGMRFPYHDGTIWWGIIDSEYNEELLSGFSSDFEGWWPLDIRSVIDEPVKPCKTCGHALADHHKLHCEADPCEFCNGWKCPEHDLILCGCTYMGGPTPS